MGPPNRGAQGPLRHRPAPGPPGLLRPRCLVTTLLACGLAAQGAGQSAQGPNLASAAAGAEVVECSSAAQAHPAGQAIDGDPTTAWVAGRHPEGEAAGPFVVVRLATDVPVIVTSVAITAAAPPGLAPDAALRGFELSVSSRTAQRHQFRRVLRGQCPPGGNRHVFTFEPVPARYVRLRVRTNYGNPDWTAVADLEVYGAPGAAPAPLSGTDIGPLEGAVLAALADEGASFRGLVELLREVGLRVDEAPPAEALSALRLSEADLVVLHILQPLPEESSLALLDAVRGGVALLALAEPAAEKRLEPIMALNDTLRETDMAVTLGPRGEADVELQDHPACQGVPELSRPGQPVNVWSLHGQPLASIGGRPLAMSRILSEGRAIVMDGGLVQDLPALDDPDALAETPHIGLASNGLFVLQCVKWLLSRGA